MKRYPESDPLFPDAAESITEEQRNEAENQVVEHHKTIDYDTREYPVEVLVQKYLDRLEDDDNDLFVPDYQREHTWPEEHQSKFIESVLIGLPIPYLFVADVPGKDGRLEIVDGSQRIRTLAAFVSNELRLSGLKKLTRLNGFRFREPMRRKALTNAERILRNPGVRVIPQSRASFLTGMALYGARPDKGYSLTDCISNGNDAATRSG